MYQKVNGSTLSVMHSIGKIGISISIMILGCIIVNDVYATDLLANTTADAVDTLKGKGKTWLYIIDFAVASGAFVMTKKPTVFFSVLGVAVAISAFLKMIGS